MKGVKYIGIPTFAFILGFVAACGLGIVVAENIASSTVDYNKNSQATVEDALDDLYSRSESCNIISETVNLSIGSNFAEGLKNNFVLDGVYGIYYHDRNGTFGKYEAGDYSYRYSGSNEEVFNYLCFGSDSNSCPEESLYRIIGVFKDSNNEYQLKIIKASVATSTMLGTNGAYTTGSVYYWHTSANNIWSASVLNKTNLNTNYVSYLNNIDNKWMGYIDTHIWKVGGNTSTYIAQTAGAQNVYYREITNPAASTTYSDEIGLMYVSDYMYGASPTYWSYQGQNNSSNGYNLAKSSNWLSLGTTERTITRRSDTSNCTFNVNTSGYVDSSTVNMSSCSVRPVFYLKSSVTYAGGSGTSSDPYRIA